MEALECVLAIETAGNLCSVALGRRGDIVGSVTELIPYNQANHLMGFIERVLNVAETTYADLTAIAVNRGPGSFTGIRVGMATAQALAFAGDLPLLGLTGFEVVRAMDSGRGEGAAKGPVLIALDTRRRDFYTAYYDGTTSPPVLELQSWERIQNWQQACGGRVITDNGADIVGAGMTTHLGNAEDVIRATSFYATHDPSRFDTAPFYMRPPSVCS